MKQNAVHFVFAGTVIRIVFRHPTVKLYLHDRLMRDILTFFSPYLSKEPPGPISSTLTIVERKRPVNYTEYLRKKRLQIDLFHEKSKRGFETYYDIGILQFHSVLFHLLFKELLHDGTVFTLHGSAVLTEAGAVLFVGDTGAGKSTIMNLLKPVCQPLSDDQIFIKRENGTFFIYQLPFFEKTFAIRKSASPTPFRHLYFLHKSKTLAVKPIDDTKTYRLLRDRITFNRDTLAMWSFLGQHRHFAHLYFSDRTEDVLQLQTIIVSRK